MNDRGRRITGAIIGGGSASRFAGRPKGLQRVGGARIIDRVAASLRPHTDSLLIAAGDADASSWISGATLAPDILRVKASVAGIHAALRAARGDVIAVAWDMPFVAPALIGELRSRLTDDIAAVVPRVSGRAEPLCAAYSHGVMSAIERQVEGGTLALNEILGSIGRIAWIEGDALERLGDPGIMFFNVNSQSDLERAEEIAGSLA